MAQPEITKSQKAEEWKWKVEDAARTLLAATKVKRDKKLYRAAIAELRRQRTEITGVVNKA